MKFKNECLGELYVKTIGKQVVPKKEFESEMSDEIVTLIKDGKLSISKEETVVKKKAKKQVFEKKSTDNEKLEKEDDFIFNKEE